MICNECGAKIPIYLKRTRSVSLVDGLSAEIHFTDTPNGELTKDDIAAEKDYLAHYDKLYKQSIKDIEKRDKDLDALDAGL